MFVEAVERGEHFIVNFAIGSHPLDFLAASVRPPADEFVRVATVRGAPLAMVPAVSNGQLVPADAELIIEGCFDKAGYTEIEGPYGEFLGYSVRPISIPYSTSPPSRTARTCYIRPSCTVPATWRAATIRISARSSPNRASGGCSARLASRRSRFTPSRAGLLHARVSLPRNPGGQARTAIAALLAIPLLKHVYVFDEDIDV